MDGERGSTPGRGGGGGCGGGGGGEQREREYCIIWEAGAREYLRLRGEVACSGGVRIGCRGKGGKKNMGSRS